MNRHSAIRKLKETAGGLGGYFVGRILTRRLPRIFMYHRFSATPQPRRMCASLFERQVQAITKHARVRTMHEVVQHVKTHGVCPTNTAVITVDDGHADFYDVAFPILKKYDVTATLYLTSRFADGEFWLWPDRVEHMLFSTERPKVELSTLGALYLTNQPARWQAWRTIVNYCTTLSPADREQILVEVAEETGVYPTLQPSDAYRAVNWDQAREMVGYGVEVGAHTRSHPILSKVSEEELGGEIAGCKADIERELQASVLSFCYPNGKPNDYNPFVKAAVSRAGFNSAVAAWFAKDDWRDLFEINRIPVSSDYTDFANKLYGIDQLAAGLKSKAVFQ